MDKKIDLAEAFKKFSLIVGGEVYTDDVHKLIYATDASAYREMPTAILVAKNKDDIKAAIKFSSDNSLPIIPRTAGTSLAGQVVGNGLIVDCSKYMNKIIEINEQEKWVRVQPGVVLDELNQNLKQYGLFFGPETSTSNRCMIGGMVGNNSCGAHSLIYGSTREHTLEVNALLSDGSEVVFKSLNQAEFNDKKKAQSLEGSIYRQIEKSLSDPVIRERIDAEFPDTEIERRNTGYSVDLLSKMQPFNSSGKAFNLCSLICGSEGTLAFITEIKLNLVPLPLANKGLLVVHHNTIEEAIFANIIALKHKPVAIELIDKFLLDCTKDSAMHSKNRFFLEGDPGALLCIELAGNSLEDIKEQASEIQKDFKQLGYGFHFPLLFGEDISKVWALRKSGLGLLSNVPGDAKPQPVIEDTAVSPYKLSEYIAEFNKVLKYSNLECVFYGHISTGELHLRPVLNLKEKEGVRLFRVIATEIARLVKKYGGSLSGEHGDGRLRGEFIPYMIGQKNYELLQEIKETWDPNNLFNPGKITNTPPMDSFLRHSTEKSTPEFKTVLDFSDTLGLVRMTDKCNGSGDCRKSAVIGGTMCPSFQATKDERNSTRARANMMREILNNNTKVNQFDSKELYDILDLCLSCKGCKTECPSGVDMTKLKAEFTYQYYKSHLRPLRMYLIASYSKLQQIAVNFSSLYNYMVSKKHTSTFIKWLVGFATERSLPLVNRVTWYKWMNKNIHELNCSVENTKGTVVLFIDEFTNYNEAHIGIKMAKLLSKLGYKLEYRNNKESGRAKLSKGFLKSAKNLAEANVNQFLFCIEKDIPLVGIEPSAILSFKDEYPDLLEGHLKENAKRLAEKVFTIEEFLAKEFKAGNISSNQFTDKKSKVYYHGHCQQKALIGTAAANSILDIPKNFVIEEIKSGCCGMAGSFGYEKEHYKLSMKIGELILFPKIRKTNSDEIIVASGTSCRHHIKDGTGKIVKHPVELLWESLVD
jgi:FAD/FMN-containing dehydrogenase/Fe-S oxidoreductase